MKIEVGEYVRTIYGEIFKVVHTTKQNEKYIFVNKVVDRNEDRAENDNVLNIEEITKHSKNIIDLICCGDYINGDKVIAVSNVTGWIDTEQSVIHKDHIKSIVTKEQFKSIEYRLED